jgi:hypothetical protein
VASANAARTASSRSPRLRIYRAMASRDQHQFPKYGRDTGLELVRLNGYPLNSLEMYGMKSLPSVLDVKTNRIDHGVSAGKHVGNCPFVVNVDLDRLKLGKIPPGLILRADALLE